jgi:hypothetical protein
MKRALGLSLACVCVLGMAVNAIADTGSGAANSAGRAKSLESVLRSSGVCKHYPIVARMVNNKEAQVATYKNRKLSDQECKILAATIAKTVMDVPGNQITSVQVRLYDPASVKYFSDVYLHGSQAKDALGSGADKERALESIRIVDNQGLVDGPKLDVRSDLYTQILRLKRSGVDVSSYMSKLNRIEDLTKNKQDAGAELSDLQRLLAGQVITGKTTTETAGRSLEVLKDALQSAADEEAAALKALEEAEQENDNSDLPWSSMADSPDEDAFLQKQVDTAMEKWQQARKMKDLAERDLEAAQQ